MSGEPRFRPCAYCGRTAQAYSCRFCRHLEADDPYRIALGDGAKLREGSALLAGMVATGPRAARAKL